MRLPPACPSLRGIKIPSRWRSGGLCGKKRPRQKWGFTLIEVLVALVILGVALGASTRVTQSVIEGSIILRRHLAGSWVAQNQINRYLVQEKPVVGAYNGREQQAGMAFVWQVDISGTPNERFWRIEVRVYPPGDTHADAVLVGYVSDLPK